MSDEPQVSRRQALAGLGAAAATLAARPTAPGVDPHNPQSTEGPAADHDKALITITFDLEMSMHYPTWDQIEWNYEKGLLDEASKKYAVEAARRVKAAGGRMHDFVVGRVFEQENVEWLKGILDEGHGLGNHTYDHVYIRATKLEDVQYRFQRAPWLVYGKTANEVILENILMSERAMKARLGAYPQGFRAPGGFSDGISTRLDLQLMLISRGYEWASTMYPSHPLTQPGEELTDTIFRGVVEAQKAAQPFVYPSGLIEIPMSPVSDVVALRTCRWPLKHFQRALREAVAWAIENRAVFDLLCHPSVIGVADPGFETLDMVLEMVRNAGSRAAIVVPETIAQRVKQNSPAKA
jgi:peptidoglycan/xylan/chitin deacetylase (PgdA/CDA1 family)